MSLISLVARLLRAVFEITCLLLLQGKFAGTTSVIKDVCVKKSIIIFKTSKMRKIKKNAKNK